MRKNLIEKLINSKHSDKRLTQYLQFNGNHQFLDTSLKNICNKFNISLDDKVDNILIKQNQTSRSVGIFASDNEELHIDFSPFEYQCQFEYKKYFILPLLDIRRIILEDLYVFKFSLKEVELHKYSGSTLEEIELNTKDTFLESFTFSMTKDNSEPHTEESPVNNPDYIQTHLSPVMKEVEDIVNSNNGRLLLCTTEENLSNLKEVVDTDLLPFDLVGNFDHVTNFVLLEKVLDALGNNLNQLVNTLEDQLDINESNSLQEKSFLDILSIVEDARIEKMYIGDLKMNNMEENNPIAPLGANYIAQEVMKYGGEVEYYPNQKFEFSANNILFKFRY